MRTLDAARRWKNAPVPDAAPALAPPVSASEAEPAPAARATPKRGKFYIDVAPMQELEYTGIPHVAAKLCEELLGDDSMEPAFFYGRHEVPIDIVEHLLRARSGSLFRWASAKFAFKPMLARPLGDYPVFGLHTNMKFVRRLFPIEGQIVHDLTTIVTPEYHTPGTNEYHQTKFYGDLMSNDVTFAVSHSTAADLLTYFPAVGKCPVVVTHLGADWAHIDQRARDMQLDVEPYILVLGTIEPRKNISIVLDLLQARPHLARMYRIVIGGRVGWGRDFEDELEERGLTPLLQSGRILQTGFISETSKYLLFKHAAAVVYPSVYEGFGLPVAEAVSLGAPIVTTASSSIPEVGKDFAHYFRPGDLQSLERALSAAVASNRNGVSRSGETLEEWRSYFSWGRCYGIYRDAFLEAAQSPVRAGGAVVHTR